MSLISVIMPVYNGQRFVDEAISSIIEQEYKEFELIIIDDGSTDSTSDILNKWAIKDKRIKVYHQNNSGIISALNKGIEQATGDYIARMDADDISHPERLRTQYQYMREYNLDVCGCDYFEIDEDNVINGLKIVPKTPGMINIALCSNVPFAHPTVMFRADFIKKNKILYGQSIYKNAEDLALWMSLHEKGAMFGNVDSILFSYRVLQNSLSRNKRKQILKESSALFNIYFKRHKKSLMAILETAAATMRAYERIWVLSLCMKLLLRTGNLSILQYIKKFPQKMILNVFLSELNKILKM
ncbi:glycosyltransferase family 2 protein [Cronobacter dublinensis]